MSVVNVEIRCRMPSFSASRVVRSARISFRRREARLNDDPAAAATESATHLPSTARPGREGLTRTRLPSRTNRALTARCRHLASSGSTAFATRLRIEPDPEAVGSDPEADELRELLRRERAHVLALERQPDRLGDECPRFGDGCFGRWGRQASARRGSVLVRASARRSVPTSRVRRPEGRRRRRRRAATGRSRTSRCGRRPERGEASAVSARVAWPDSRRRAAAAAPDSPRAPAGWIDQLTDALKE